MYQFFYEEDTPPTPALAPTNGTPDWTTHRRAGRAYLTKLRFALSKMSDRDRMLLLNTATLMARRAKRNGH
jgi:hypothetical protein